MIKGVNHIGIVVKNIDEMVEFLNETFGAEEISRIEFPEFKQISALVRIGDVCFELMEPTAPHGTVGKFLETKGVGLHHISLLCDDIESFCKEIEIKGLKIINKMFDRPNKLAFIHPKSAKGILVELTENSSLKA